MLINEPNLDQLRVQFEKRFSEGYNAAALVLDPLYMTVTSSTGSNRYGWVAQQIGLREWTGPRVAQNLREHQYTLTNLPYEGTVEVDKYDIEDDNLGMYDGVIMPQLGEAVRKHPELLVAALIQANPVAFDGLALFHDAHLSFDAAGSTYDNLEASAFALNATNLAAVQAKAAGYKGEDGQPLEIRFTHLFVPPQLEFTAKQIMQSATYASLVTGEGAGAVQIENQMRGSMTVVVVPKFANQATTWYVADLSKVVKPVVYQVRKAPEFVSLDRPTDPKAFEMRKFYYGVEKRCNVGVTLPFLIHKAVG